MNILQAIVLGIAQGFTEFIPVSSSGHLLLLHHAMGLDQNGLGFDVALHIGTLCALLVFFYHDIIELVISVFKRTEKTHLAWMVALATVPAVVAGVILQDLAETTFRSPQLVCIALASMAFVMLAAERYSKSRKARTSLEAVSVKQSLSIGFAQAAALVPGVSRSGSTITTGLFLGLDRVAATRFSFLLSIPVTAGAILKVTTEAQTIADAKATPGLFVVGIITAFLSGMFAIRFLLKFVAKHSLNVFAYYRLVLAGAVLILLVAL